MAKASDDKGRMSLRRPGEPERVFDVASAELEVRRAGRRWLWRFNVHAHPKDDMSLELESTFFEHPIAGPNALREAVFEFGRDHPTNPAQSWIRVSDFQELRANRIEIRRKSAKRFAVIWDAICPDIDRYDDKARDHEVRVEALFRVAKVREFDNYARVLVVSPHEFQGRGATESLQERGYSAELAKPHEALRKASSMSDADVIFIFFVEPAAATELTRALSISGNRAKRFVVVDEDAAARVDAIAADKILCVESVDEEQLFAEIERLTRA